MSPLCGAISDPWRGGRDSCAGLAGDLAAGLFDCPGRPLLCAVAPDAWPTGDFGFGSTPPDARARRAPRNSRVAFGSELGAPPAGDD